MRHAERRAAAGHLRRRAPPPPVVSNILQTLWPHLPLAVWDDVAVLTPWDRYRAFGDVAFLSRQYESMVAWVDRGLGDWLDPATPLDKPQDTRSSGALVAGAHLVRVRAPPPSGGAGTTFCPTAASTRA
ncbi:hypothetical protein HMPREF1624_07777 [Sporothrix schenckii ATCC 58251]|uniref:Alpha-L-rhamnosidase six-hairpin glycosidase domain-containing protein n=1 Tax=Sporothrix schenckii (strain ATCC 58251 / de Perez 2211183) TaxID=1391915 RepID=U7PJH9_SPOS1|nr:hypothetical protein HMPREF1624_07777 [Sporothrix schenckii ATCC 58251]